MVDLRFLTWQLYRRHQQRLEKHGICNYWVVGGDAAKLLFVFNYTCQMS